MVCGGGRKDTKGCMSDIFENDTLGEDRRGWKGGVI